MLRNLRINGNTTISDIFGNPLDTYGNGIRTHAGVTTVSHSLVLGNAGMGLGAAIAGVINAESNVLSGNNIAVQTGNGRADQGTATVRLSNNYVYGNRTGFGCAGGVLASDGTNRKGNNLGGSVPACSPTVTITEQ